jgi:SnoaL-like domain
MTKIALAVLVSLCAFTTDAPAQQKRAPATAPQELVREWFRRWNALDGTDLTAKRFIDLYEPTAIHQTEPSEKQIGPVYYEGHEALRKLVDDFTKTATQIAFHIDKVVSGAKSVELFFMSEGPWDGPAVGVQYTGVYIDRNTKKRHSFPGFAVFYVENGKFRHARFYTTREENVEE